MPIYKKLNEDIEEVDVIIAGGGTAGCVVAGRLAAADPTLAILVIEWGRDNYDDPKVVVPAMWLQHMIPEADSTIFYQTNKSEYLADREAIVPAGGILGGGSSINYMMYTRAQRSDFDSWQTPGWSADEMLPYLKKLETYHGPGDMKYHGSDGQDLDSNNGFQRWLRYVSPEGRRSDAAHCYVHPLLQDGKHPNLHVLVQAKVVRVLFDENKRACGVEYTPNPHFQVQVGMTASPQQKFTVRARKTVVVSAGACGSPSILERSGLGPPEVLQKAGVSLVEELPGVGHGYQDHHLILYPFRTSLAPEDTIDALIYERIDPEQAATHPHLGWNSCDIAAKLRPNDEDVKALGPAFQAAWEKDFKNIPDRPLMLMAVLNGFFGEPTAVEPGQYMTLAPYTAYPYSRGHVHITGPEVSDRLDFDIGFFNDPNDLDLKKQVWAYKKGREIMRRTAMYRGEIAAFHPKFPDDSRAACIESAPAEQIPQGEAELADLEYSAEDDGAIEQYIRENIGTTWHSLGTARMAPREELGVVDEKLSVYGVQGLKVVDLSIVPKNIGGNTNNTALAVGEKASDIIAQELGLSSRHP